MMHQFVVWNLYGVRYLCERSNEGSDFLTTIKRL